MSDEGMLIDCIAVVDTVIGGDDVGGITGSVHLTDTGDGAGGIQ